MNLDQHLNYLNGLEFFLDLKDHGDIMFLCLIGFNATLHQKIN
ncbi:uncharacterized protein METZ01_LOCUS96634 [marine metagenome]|uniref:Uncharacterized protein n=1 Tax=marine metagenome TaxID=408172 RepID=A0A381VU04_9ZZZZ